jgi:hypothetical protein
MYHDDRLVEQTSIYDIAWKTRINDETIPVKMRQPYVDLQALKVSQGRATSRLKTFPAIGKGVGPGGRGGRERLSQYFRQ